MKVGIVDVGGGLRGIYSAGIYDYCIDRNISFDLCIGVSAGSANIVTFLAGQKQRNYTFYTEYSSRKEYMSIRNYIKEGNYIDLDYIYSTLANSDGENPLNYKNVLENPTEFVIVATDAESGEAVYFTKDDLHQDSYDVLKASANLPVVCKPYNIDRKLYYDGAISDTIPIQKAFDMGCDKVILILTKPKDIPRSPKKDQFLSRFLKRKYPLAAEGLKHRCDNYNKWVEIAKEYEKEGKLLLIAPSSTCGVDTLKKDKKAMDKLYQMGYEDGKRIEELLSIK